MSTSNSDGYYDLGAYARPITTTSPDTQKWFTRGLNWGYAFNHEESAACFARALDTDPTCAIAHWGVAYASGPNYNKPWELFDKADLQRTLDRIARAVEAANANAASASPLERALVHAVQFRHPRSLHDTDYAAHNVAYAEAMGDAYKAFGADVDVAALYADALMNITPWALWDLATGKPAPKPARTLEAKAVLERALAQPDGFYHPGLLHLYIHLMEMSPTPEIAIPPADRLRALCPDAGHMNHMPSHLDILIGDYRRSIASNTDAVLADEKFLARTGGMNFYTLYRMHNYHSLIYAAMFAGQSRVAFEAVERMEAALPQELLRQTSPPMADWLETFMSVRPHVLIRFGRWEDILALPLPEDQELYSVTTATAHYAKGVAHAALGDVADAEQAREQFLAALARVPDSRMDFPNKSTAILAVAAAMLDGEIAYRKGEHDAAFAHLRKSIALDDGLNYTEPWGWMQPTRHAYAALLLEQGRVQEAADAYRADLGLDATLARARQHPNNVWALHGYHECLVRLGREAEAGIVKPMLRLAVAVADVEVVSSCFCRREVGAVDAQSAACCRGVQG
ncbi:uncharacterized protein K452DRAFT_292335 [Aplosporella prunicola CBS 121167]|uniref:TPR domain protein n=1 Tax=Aplosporella prunicola CBS 121167 TaxID=1176127 RepID=A0A6A6AYZ3_9PEZI|nr:uncharacterized protein K452DRAFT_292335 [Aplosporella prunicola CBS 121167]KAF2136488.1 hypothetical protein K452DRAFT_292335 [Aplosporella prunicola CBS 121167]